MHLFPEMPKSCLFCPQHHEFPGHCALPVGYGSHDHVENPPQGHCSIQPDG